MSKIIDLLEQSLPANCYLFKHSTTCPISAAAASEVRKIQAPLDIYWVNVIEQRALSNWIEKTYGIRHESPQLLLIEQGEVKKVWNHRQIKASDVLAEN